MNKIKWITLLLILGSIATITLFVFFRIKKLPPPLTIRIQDDVAIIDLQLLGEYPTLVRQMKIEDLTKNEVIWDIRAKNEYFGVWWFELRSGENSLLINNSIQDGFEVYIPNTGGFFNLNKQRQYQITIIGKEGLKKAIFAFEK